MFAHATSFSRTARCARRRATLMSGAVARTTANAEALFTGREFRSGASKGQCEVVSGGPGRRIGFNHQACDQSVSVAPGEHHGRSELPAQNFAECPQECFAEVFILPGADTVMAMPR